MLNPTKVIAHCPPILRAAKLLGTSIEQSGQLPKTLVALGIPCCLDQRLLLLSRHHSVRVMEGDEGEAKLQAAPAWRDSALFVFR